MKVRPSSRRQQSMKIAVKIVTATTLRTVRTGSLARTSSFSGMAAYNVSAPPIA